MPGSRPVPGFLAVTPSGTLTPDSKLKIQDSRYSSPDISFRFSNPGFRCAEVIAAKRLLFSSMRCAAWASRGGRSVNDGDGNF
jgi:hypothetical protein